MANRDFGNERIGAAMTTRTAAEWVERITRAGGLCERVREVEEAWADPLLAERGLVGQTSDGAALPLVSLARAASPRALAAAPGLGQHSEEVRAELSGG